MSAEQRLKEGDLAGALSALQNEVRDDPSNADKRRFLFQLLSVLGGWDRALTQLEVLADLDAKSLVIVAAYRAAIRAEKQRVDIYAGKQSPMIFGEPQRWVANMVEAMRLEASGSVEQAQELRDEGLEEAPAVAGSINDVPFNWIADSDSRLGPILEAIVDGDLYWVPFDRIQKIEIEPPVDLRDLVWTPAQFCPPVRTERCRCLFARRALCRSRWYRPGSTTDRVAFRRRRQRSAVQKRSRLLWPRSLHFPPGNGADVLPALLRLHGREVS